MYAIKFERAARAELDAASATYGQAFGEAVTGWLNELARAAPTVAPGADPPGGLDLDSLAATYPSEPDDPLWVWLRSHRSGPRLCVAVCRVLVLGVFWETVYAAYQIDHEQARVIIRLFHGLPGQGS